ncbi:cytosine-specific methyltransferase [Lactococcus hodotermopsidis]|uniref:Cytosine-specific methyltransferase n=1 Tax=Pseudolactococcus hodotermopsidis TaxID=2709157 RepID=A0A6A0BAM2_9LACT|nr:DNA cytosine methyltransferase [Lactococcus hodotermopsidis]GFH41856.1 cytosine-specific methyltransferase [Lactococcus hodotermopsidis]
MSGGKRVGAGRKAKSELEKKKQKNIYIPEELYEEVMKAPIAYGDSFSSRCEFLIEEGLANFAVYNKNREDKVDKLTFIDLFAGIGGIRQAFEDDKTKAVFSSEWDKFAAATYEANFGEKPHGDITQIKAEEIPKHDVLLAGFPCQPFSMIGKREGFSHATQGTLFFDVLRIIKHHQPKMFLLENVQGLLTIQNGETFRIIKSALKEVGYDVFSDVLDAQNYGLPQVRKRVVIVGFRKDLEITNFDLPQGSNNRVPVSQILEENPNGYTISEHLQNTYLFKKNDGKPQIIDENSDIQVKTLVASYHKIQRLTGTFVKGGDTGIRLLSELECKRLMGFPDDFKVPVSRTQMYRQFGNSVAVPMMKAVADCMKERLFLAESLKLKDDKVS